MAWAQWKDFLLAAARALMLPMLALRKFTPFKSASVMTNPPVDEEPPAAPRGDCLSLCGVPREKNADKMVISTVFGCLRWLLVKRYTLVLDHYVHCFVHRSA